MRLTVAVSALLLAACRPDVQPEKMPEIVRVTVEVPVSLCPGGGSDCPLLRDCYDEDPKEQTYGEAKRLANLRRASIREDCNVRMGKIRALQPPKKPPAIEGRDK